MLGTGVEGGGQVLGRGVEGLLDLLQETTNTSMSIK